MAKKKALKKQPPGPGALGQVGLLAALAGAGLFLLTGKASAAPSPAKAPVPAPPPAPVPGAAKTAAPAVPKPPAPAPVKPGVPAPATAPAATEAGQTQAKTPAEFVFVDSWNGEGIFETVGKSYLPTEGYGRGRIATPSDKEYVGLRTGRKENGMIEIYAPIAGKAYNFWIEESETRAFRAPGMEEFVKTGGGKARSAHVTLLIQRHFAAKYSY